MDSVWAYVALAACLTVIVYSEDAPDTSQLKITRMEMCDSSMDYPLMINNEIKTKGDKQFMSGKSVFKVDFGADSDYNITINMKRTVEDPEFSPLLTFYEEDTCQAVQKYLGEFVEEMEKAVGLNPGKCPIAKGTYTLTDYPLDFGKAAYQTIPEGVLQAIQTITNKKTKEVLLCMITEAENFPKK